MGREGQSNGCERRLRLVGKNSSEEESMDGRSTVNIQIERVCDSMHGRQQMKDT